ncbi:N-myc-interactor isoform X2 [Parambassis ranga]|nr:N-myc-interactor-like isoform X2 [Parambassis ranga]
MDELEEAKKELEMWKTKFEKADDMKARLLLEKLEEDDAKTKAQQEMMACIEKQEKNKKEFSQRLSIEEDKIRKLTEKKRDLLDQLRKSEAELEAKKAECTKLKQKFKIYAQIPDTAVKFTAPSKEARDGTDQPIRGVFTIRQRASVFLQGQQALITFEEDKVASQILRTPKCSVSCGDSILNVKPKRIVMDPAVKFEVHLDVSRKEVKVSNIPPSLPVERIQDRLEISFSRPSRGGGEVERVEYDKNTGTGHIIFHQTGVAESLTRRGRYQVHLDSEVNVQVRPICHYQLYRFQTFCGAPKRTILLDGIVDTEDEEDLQDLLEIHFQKPSNGGGEIESITYISSGKTLQAFFCEDNSM